jgi:hypothetical protein
MIPAIKEGTFSPLQISSNSNAETAFSGCKDNNNY